MMHCPELPPEGPNDGLDGTDHLRNLQALALWRFSQWNKEQMRKKLERLLDPNCTDPRREDAQLAIEALECLKSGHGPDEDQLRALAECLDIEVIVGSRGGRPFFEIKHRS